MTPIKRETPFVFHFRHRKNDGTYDERGGVTIVFNPATRTFGAARCSKKDSYSKKRGRIIACNRAEKNGQTNTVPALEEGDMFVETVRHLADKIGQVVDKTKNPRTSWFEVVH